MKNFLQHAFLVPLQNSQTQNTQGQNTQRLKILKAKIIEVPEYPRLKQPY